MRSLVLTLTIPLCISCAEGDPIDQNAPSGASGGAGGVEVGGGGMMSAGGSVTTGGMGTGASGGMTTGGGGLGGGGQGGDGGLGGGGTGGGGMGGGGTGGMGPMCGDGALEGIEECDMGALGGATCTNIGQGFIGGTLGCTGGCTYDTSACTSPPDCGNGTIQAGEDCDMGNLNGASCSTFGLSSGVLTCTSGCSFDTSGCYQCNNGTIQGPEVCENGNLNGQSCTTLGHDGGTLFCAGNCLSFNENNCTDCGDGSIEGTEVCEPGNLGGQSCVSQGFKSGTLTCTSSCNAFVTTGCVAYACSDGLDNDADGYTDANDPGCASGSDDAEDIFSATCSGLGGPVYDISYSPPGTGFTITGSNVGAPNNFQPTDFADDCTSTEGGGGEVIMFFRNEITQDVLLSLDNPGTNFDTMLYVRQAGCGTGFTAELCTDDISGSVFRSEMFVTDLPPGDYWIFVDGWSNLSQGNFELSVDFF